MDEHDRQLLDERIDRPAVQVDLAALGRIDAREDLDQGRLAGAVLAEQRVHLAALDLEVDGVERERAGEALAEPVKSRAAASALPSQRGSAFKGAGRRPARGRSAPIALPYFTPQSSR